MLFFLLVAQAVVSTDFWGYQSVNDRVTSALLNLPRCPGCKFCHTEE